MKNLTILSLISNLLFAGSGFLGIGHLNENIELKTEIISKDSIILAQAKFIVADKPITVIVVHDTLKQVHNSLIYKKQFIVTPLTNQESLRIGNFEYPIIQKLKMDSFLNEVKKIDYQIIVKKKINNDK